MDREAFRPVAHAAAVTCALFAALAAPADAHAEDSGRNGTLEVSTEPPRAQVFRIVGDEQRPAGLTPLTKRVPEGTYELLVTLDGFKPVRMHATIVATEPARVKLTLESEVPDNGGPASPIFRANVRQTVKDNRAGAQECVELHKARATGPVHGSVVMAFTVGLDGVTSGAHVMASQVDVKEMLDCLTQLFASLQYPPPDRGKAVPVEYPIWIGADAPGAMAVNAGSMAATGAGASK